MASLPTAWPAIPPSKAPAAAPALSGATLPERLERYEADILKQALTAHRGDVKETLQALGIPRKTFYDKLQRHGINRADFIDRAGAKSGDA